MNALKRNFKDDLTFLERLLSKFELQVPRQLQLIGEALQMKDVGAAAEAAHRLAGETGVFYSVAARQTALRLEELARSGNLAGAKDTCAALSTEIDRLVQALRALPSH